MLQREWPAGLMHAVIFAGFMILLIRKVQLLVIGWYEPFVYPGAFGAGFAWLKDLVELTVPRPSATASGGASGIPRGGWNRIAKRSRSWA
jgi:hypothetical protein